MWNSPCFCFSPIVMSMPVRWLLTTCFRLLQECPSIKQENTQTYVLVFLSEAVRTLNLLHTCFSLLLTTSTVRWKPSVMVFGWVEIVFQAYSVLNVVFVHGPMVSSVCDLCEKVRDGVECKEWQILAHVLWGLSDEFASWSLVQSYSRFLWFPKLQYLHTDFWVHYGILIMK